MFTLFALIFGKHLPPGLRYGILAIGLTLLAWRIHRHIKKSNVALVAKTKPTKEIPKIASPEVAIKEPAKQTEISTQELSGLRFAGFR